MSVRRLAPPAAATALAAVLGLSLPAQGAAQGFTVVEDVVQLALLPGWRTDRGTHMTALRVDLAEGWKTYWRAPGEGGIPPVFDWGGSANVGGVTFHWPRPVVFDQLGLKSVGYLDQLVLPMEVNPRDPSRPIVVDASVQIGVCEDICIPVTLDVRADLPAGVTTPDPVIRAALADRPMTAAEAGVGHVSCAVDPIADGLRVTARIDLPALGGGEAVVFEATDASLWISEAAVTRDGGRLTARADFVPESGRPFALDRSGLRLTVIGGGKAVDLRGCRAP